MAIFAFYNYKLFLIKYLRARIENKDFQISLIDLII